MASCGGKHALYNAFQALFEEGDEVIVPAPYWVSYPDMLLLAGATPTHRRDDHRRAGLPDERRSSSMRACGPRTVGLVLNSPSNPTGAVYSSDELRALGQVALRRKLIVFTDDIYEHIAERTDREHRRAGAGAAPAAGRRQRGVEELRHDGLAHRIHGGAGAS